MRAKIEVEKVKDGYARLLRASPSRNPEAVGAALAFIADRVRVIAYEKRLSGPRPRFLDSITGELRGSLRVNKDGLPFGVVVGTPLAWAPVHEFGSKRKRAFLLPSLDEALPTFPAIMERKLLEAIDRKK